VSCVFVRNAVTNFLTAHKQIQLPGDSSTWRASSPTKKSREQQRLGADGPSSPWSDAAVAADVALRRERYRGGLLSKVKLSGWRQSYKYLSTERNKPMNNGGTPVARKSQSNTERYAKLPPIMVEDNEPTSSENENVSKPRKSSPATANTYVGGSPVQKPRLSRKSVGGSTRLSAPLDEVLSSDSFTRMRRMSVVISDDYSHSYPLQSDGTLPGFISPPIDADNGEISTPRHRHTGDEESPFSAPGKFQLSKGTRVRRLSMDSAASRQDFVSNLKTFHGRVKAGSVSVAGTESGAGALWKMENQDVILLAPAESSVVPGVALFGVFDGHGKSGKTAAVFARIKLSDALQGDDRMLSSDEQDVREAFEDAFMTTDVNMRRSVVDTSSSGTTSCIVSLTETGYLHCGWVGDSRAVVAVKNSASHITLTAEELSRDHTPNVQRERSRIEACGARVDRFVQDGTGERIGPLRVFARHSYAPGLSTTRTLGNTNASDLGVISTPEVRSLRLTGEERFVIVATDGVWQFITSQEAVDVCAQHENAFEAANALVQRAKELWEEHEADTSDDITCVVVNLQGMAL